MDAGGAGGDYARVMALKIKRRLSLFITSAMKKTSGVDRAERQNQ